MSAGLDRVFQALGDPTRRRILERLARAEQPVMELARRFTISQPAVTKHLHVLEAAGLIARRKEGRVRWCRLLPGVLSGPQQWIERCRSMWEDRLDALEEYLAETSSEE